MQLWAEDVIVHYPGGNCFSGSYNSLEEVLDHLTEVEAHGGSHVSEVYFISGNDKLAAVNYCEDLAWDGRPFPLVRTNIYRVEDEKIVEGRLDEQDQ
jgi:ketosteroid isomerase-like protein